MKTPECDGADTAPRTTGTAVASRRPADAQREGEERSPRLGVRQRRFVEEYLVDMSPVRAAERAGYAPVRAARTAARLLGAPAVQQAVEQAMDRRAARTGVTQDRVVRELAAVGFAVMTDLCHWSDEGVRLRDSVELTRAQAAAVAEVREASTARTARGARATRPARTTEEEQPEAPVRGGVQVKLHSKLKALEMLARHLGMFGTATGADGDAPPGGGARPELPGELRARIDELYPLRAAGSVQGHGGDCVDGGEGAGGTDDGDEEDTEDREDDGFDGDGWGSA
ncbi:terminase small subunit [Nitratidesulfovibrio sp.]|uniref:terminase small subunit n=1 Tax=Nitratidesulfovibrio sp. TaxID=2802297 RepID=UPI00333E614C